MAIREFFFRLLMRTITSNIVPALPTVVAVLGLSCSESLPTHTDPGSLFQSTSTISFQVPKSGFPQLWIYLSARNGFDETLQDTSALEGHLEIILDRDPRYHKTVVLGLSNLITTGAYNPQSNLLTINSGDSVALLYRWNFYADGGAYLPEIFDLQQDSLCPLRMTASAEFLTIRGSVRLYKRTATVASPTVHYVLNYVLGSC